MKLSSVILFVFGFRSTRYCCLNLPASLWLLHFGMFVAHLFAVFMLFPIKFSDCLSTPAFTCLLFYVLCSSFFHLLYLLCDVFPLSRVSSDISILNCCIYHVPTFRHCFTSFYCLVLHCLNFYFELLYSFPDFFLHIILLFSASVQV